MNVERISTNHMVKIGIVVDNIEKAVQYYADIFNIEKPEIHVHDHTKDPVPTSDEGAYTWYDGEYRNYSIKVAMVMLEPIYIELIEPFDEPSPWTEFKKRHGQGVHYMAFDVEGFQDHIDLMERNGMKLIQKTEKGPERYAYFDTVPKLGLTVEFKEIGEK
jgi:methylmalonyl-CoA/ethylmalonyl-CoA epimerase